MPCGLPVPSSPHFFCTSSAGGPEPGGAHPPCLADFQCPHALNALASPMQAGLSQEELIRRAFAGDDVAAEFAAAKAAEVEGELPQARLVSFPSLLPVLCVGFLFSL